MRDQNNNYQNFNDLNSSNMPPEFLPGDYDSESSFDQDNSQFDNDSNGSIFRDSKVITAIVAVLMVAIAIVAAVVFFLTTNKNKPSNNSVATPSKTCVQLRKKALHAQKGVIKSLSDDDVLQAINIKKTEFISDSDEAKDAFDDFESSLNYAKSDAKEKLPNCPVGADSENSPSVENKLSDKIDSFHQDRDALVKSAKAAIKASKSAVSNKLLKLVNQGQELIDKTKNVPIFGDAQSELEKVVDLARKALIKSNNNDDELKQCITDLQNALKDYLAKIKELSSDLANRDGNGYPLNAPHPKDDQGGYAPVGRSNNPESSNSGDGNSSDDQQ